MSVHNGERHLRPAIESILKQTFRDFEFIIVNDGSTDGSEEILREYAQHDHRIRVLSHEHLGLPKTLNAGLAIARGEFIAKMDADDIAMPHRFAVQVEIMERNPDLVVYGCQVIEIDDEGAGENVREFPILSHEVKLGLLLRSTISHPGAMMRRDAIEQIGGYDESHLIALDYGLWWRLIRCGRFANHAVPLLYYRLHNKNITLSRTRTQLEYFEKISREALVTYGLVDSLSNADRVARIARDVTSLKFHEIREYVHFWRRFLNLVTASDGASPAEAVTAWQSIVRDLLARARRHKSFRQRLAWRCACLWWLAAVPTITARRFIQFGGQFSFRRRPTTRHAS